MALTKIKCPECGAPLKSADGFTPGENVSCPKCETAFTVKPPRGEDEEDTKGARVEDDEEEEIGSKKKKSYKNSPLRFAVLGILVIVMLVLGYMLYEKKKKERENASTEPSGLMGRVDGTAS